MIRTSFKLTKQSCIDKPIIHDAKSSPMSNACRLLVKSRFQNFKPFSNLTNSNAYNNINNTRINYNKHLRSSYGLNKKSNTEHVIIRNQDNIRNFNNFNSNNNNNNSASSYSNFNKISSAPFKNIKNNFILNQINNFKLKTYQEKRSVSYLLKTKEIESYTDMMNPTINYFAHSFIDRCSDRRKDQKWIDEQMKSDKAVFVLFHIDKVNIYYQNNE